MLIKTHQLASAKLLGTPVEVIDGKRAKVTLVTSNDMAVDNHMLVHGGFTFSLADYSAMLAINHPNVVLGSANVRFFFPVKVGDKLEATADVLKNEGKKWEVLVEIKNDGKNVFKGTFTCFILDHHVLS